MSVLWQQSTHGVPKRREGTDSALARVFILTAAAMAVVTALYLSLVFWNVRIAEGAWDSTEELIGLQKENQRLRVEIAKLSSIPVLQERSVALGYQPAESVEYVYVGAP